MKRTDITELFPEASPEAIDKLMGINGTDINTAKAELESLKKQLADLKNNQNNEELNKAQQQIAQLNAELNGMKSAETLRLMREKVAGEKKVPAHLLSGETEEACAKQAEEILAFAKQPNYPVVHDSGEPENSPKSTPREAFANWMNEIMNN